MTTRLPLVAAQPGIWMAERLSTLPGAWSVAHYVELRGALDPALLGKAIVAGLQQADTLSLRFEEEEGEYPIGHARRRNDGMPKLVEKFKINLARQFPTRQQQRILDVSLDRARLEQMPVNEYMDLFII